MQEICRDRHGDLPVFLFKLYTCAMCYKYLFHAGNELVPHKKQPWKLGPIPGSSSYRSDLLFEADITNQTVRDLVCSTLNGENCSRWTDCCHAARSCCEAQLATPRRNISQGEFCPRTWDGYGCFGDTLPGQRVEIPCPRYVDHASAEARAYKDCTENGTWWKDPTTNSEWTNYSTCIATQDYKTVVYVALACNILSLVLLIPACGIFLYIRQLRTQKRIKLHLCLFLSFIITSLITILWDFLVYMNRLENEKDNTLMHKNTAGCKLLYVLGRYIGTANFVWMFCEGFYLHRLIVHAFTVPKSLIPYYICGWVVSWIPVTVYSIIRATNDVFNQSCWVNHIGNYEWIMYTPNLLCIAANVLFLGNILRILCSKLQAQANEPSNYRKALKATFVLIPLFGLQQFLVIYRPPAGAAISFAYEIFQSVIKNTQGAAVSLIFCFFNGEVHSYLKSYIGKHWKSGRLARYARKSSEASATQITSVQSGRRGTRTYETDNTGYIPLSTSSTANDNLNNSANQKQDNGHVTFAT